MGTARHERRCQPAHLTSELLDKLLFVLLLLSSNWFASCAEDIPQPKAGRDTRITHPQAGAATRGDVLPGSYIVSFRTKSGDSRPTAPSFLQEFNEHSQALESLIADDFRVKTTRFLTSWPPRGPVPEIPDAMDQTLAPPLSRLNPQQFVSEDLSGSSILQIDFQSEIDAQEALEEWDARGHLVFAEPNGVSHISSEKPPKFDELSVAYRNQQQWWTERIALPQAFTELSNSDWTKFGQDKGHSPIIAVLDSGVDYEHPALVDRIWTNPQKGISGCDDDLHGCDTTNSAHGRLGTGSVWPFDLDGPGKTCIGKDLNCSHGTHVAGIIAADSSWIPPGGDHPVLGICPVCRIMILKVVSKVGGQSGILDSSIIAALKYISMFRNKRGAQVRVINASFGKFSKSRAVELMLHALRKDGGTLIVGAAGNEDSMRLEYPAAFSDVLAVAAVDENLRKLPFSNFGSWIDISAPGSNIDSTVPGQRIDSKSGTSMAAPMVSAVAGLLIAQSPDLGVDELRDRILRSSDPSLYGRTFDPDGMNARYYDATLNHGAIRQPLLGFGVVNANGALTGKQSPDLPEATNTARVKPGCGTVMLPATHHHSAISMSYLTLLLCPILGVFQIFSKMLRFAPILRHSKSMSSDPKRTIA